MEVTTGFVVKKFVLTSLFMWAAPLSVLSLFKIEALDFIKQLSPEQKTMFCGFGAVLSVNLVVAVYIVFAFMEPSSSKPPQPDPAYVAAAEAAAKKLRGDEDTQLRQRRNKEESSSASSMKED